MRKETNSFTIYNASAGSGKTYTLVKEYLKIILSSKKNDAYRNILAITFTNKAVNEMKSRIVDSLSEFTKDNPNKKAADLMLVLSTEIDKSILEIKTKSQQIIKHIIHNYAAFDISTIDKFTHRVIRAFALDLGLPMSFEVTLDTENLLAEAVDAIIARAGDDDVLTKLLVDFAIEKADNDKSWEVSREIFQTGKMVLNENHRNEISEFQDKSIQDFIDVKTKLNSICEDLAAKNIEIASQIIPFIEKQNINVDDFFVHFINHIVKLRDGIDIGTNKRYLKVEDIGIKKTVKNVAEIEGMLPTIIDFLDQIYKTLGTIGFYAAFLKNITPLSLLNTIGQEFAKIQEEKNTLSISEFNAIIHKEIQNQPAPFIYERLGERYRHFFIDEFQDTSEMQWQNLIPLINNSIAGQDDLGQKGTLMLVGDPKQSIYRWRGGKAEQFIELCKTDNANDPKQNPFSNKDKFVDNLETNYRSYSEVINFNNKMFKMLAKEFSNNDYQDLYAQKSHQKINNKTGGFANISFIPHIVKSTNSNPDNDEDADFEESNDKTAHYCEATLNTILNVVAQGFEFKEIAVLTRKRDQGIAIANHLTENKIPILSSETLLLKNATEVQLIILVLTYLKNSQDRESKAYFLYHLAQEMNLGAGIHDFVAAGILRENELEFEQWLLDFDINLSFQDVRKKSLYEVVETIISKFLSFGTMRGKAYVQYFLDIVLERDARNQAGISDFLEFWSKNAEKFSVPSPEGTNAVRILTIHKSKGLEFPVVIMPFAEEDYGKKPKDQLWVPTNEAILGLPKILINNTSTAATFGADAKALFDQKKQEELLDNVNVLYVALTRAEEQLYVISYMNLSLEKLSDEQKANKEKATKMVPRDNNMSSFFIKYLEQENKFDADVFEYKFGKEERLSRKVKFENNNKKIEIVADTLEFKNIKIAQRESMMWGTVQQEAISFGNVVHEILSFIATESDVDFAIQKAIESGIINNSQKFEIKKSIDQIMNHIDLKAFFSAENKILNEQTIIQKEGKTVKPDRIVINKKNEVYLLDYKTGLPENKHVKQLENYRNQIEKMGFKVAKQLVVYIGEKIDVKIVSL